MNKIFAILGTISLSMLAACSDTKTAKETATAETAGVETAAPANTSVAGSETPAAKAPTADGSDHGPVP